MPEQVAGTWRLGDGTELVLEQEFQELLGKWRTREGVAESLRDAQMTGPKITFTVGGLRHDGELKDGVLEGVTAGGAPWRATRVRG